MAKNIQLKARAEINKEIKSLELEEKNFIKSFTDEMATRLTVRVVHELNGLKATPTNEELIKMAQDTKEIHTNKEYNLLIAKTAEELSKALIRIPEELAINLNLCQNK